MTKIMRYRGRGLRTRHPLRGVQVGRLAMSFLVGVALTVVSAGTAHALSYAYVAASVDNTVKKIFLANNTVVDTITVGNTPSGVCLSPNELFVYVPNFDSDTVSVISTITDTVVATITAGTNAHSCAVTPDASEVWVTNMGTDTVSVIATATNTVSATVSVGDRPFRIVVSPAATHVYVANLGNIGVSDGTVSVLDATTRAVVATIAVGGDPWGIDISRDAGTLYVATRAAGNSVQRIATATNTVTGTLTLAAANTLALTPDDTKLYVSNETTAVFVIDTATFAVETGPITVASIPDSLATTPDGTTLYVGSQGSNMVSVISTSTNAVTATITGINGAFFSARLFGTRLLYVGGIPTLPEWAVILLTLSLLAIATWQLAGVPAVATGVSGTVMMSHGSWLTSMVLGQVTATVGLGFYALLVGPLVAHDGIGAFSAGVLFAVIIEGYRRTR